MHVVFKVVQIIKYAIVVITSKDVVVFFFCLFINYCLFSFGVFEVVMRSMESKVLSLGKQWTAMESLPVDGTSLLTGRKI